MTCSTACTKVAWVLNLLACMLTRSGLMLAMHMRSSLLHEGASHVDTASVVFDG